jgi:hypothetical protein
MPGISIHVVDIAHGVTCEGMEVALFHVDASGGVKLISQGKIDHRGLLDGDVKVHRSLLNVALNENRRLELSASVRANHDI